MKRVKPPGLDGFPPELFLELWDIVVPLILGSNNHEEFHRDQNTSLIIVLLKFGESSLDCKSFRPLMSHLLLPHPLVVIRCLLDLQPFPQYSLPLPLSVWDCGVGDRHAGVRAIPYQLQPIP